MSDKKDHFVSLATLYFEEGVSAVALADAIERGGVWGWDRFDRFGLFKEGAHFDEALNRLARQFAFDSDSRGDGADLDPPTDPLFFYGWMASKLPDFGKLGQSQQPAKPRPGDVSRITRTDLGIMAALLLVFEGKANCNRHPDFPTSEKLIAHLAEYMQGYSGLSKRTFEQRFAAARRVIDKPE